MCGSAELVELGNCGLVFRPENHVSLSEALSRILESPEKWRTYSTNGSHFARHLTPERAAQYFLEIVDLVMGNFEGRAPRPPWQSLRSPERLHDTD
jgi:glycosyltransferase involved in cell wall biosynthesis